jgi:hypothetical protein
MFTTFANIRQEAGWACTELGISEDVPFLQHLVESLGDDVMRFGTP